MSGLPVQTHKPGKSLVCDITEPVPCWGREDFDTLPAMFQVISTHLRIVGETENTQAWVSVFCVLPLAQGVPVRWDQQGWPR